MRAAPQAAWRPPGQSDWKMERKANKEYLKQERREMRGVARMPQYQTPYYSAPQWQARQSYSERYSYPREQYQSYRDRSPQVYQNYAYVPQYNYGYAPQNYSYAPQYYDYGNTPQYYGNYSGSNYGYESYLPYANRSSYSNYEPYYYYDDVNYNRHTSWKYQLLAMVLQAFLGGRDNYGGNPYYGNQYAYSQPYSTRYASYGRSYGSYDSQPYGYDSSYYDTGLFDTVPFFGLTNDYPGGFGNDLAFQTLSYGYDQGYYAGEYCRRHKLGEDSYYDPYFYEDTGYDPYSVSIAENRRYLSEGYELGYRDGYRAAHRGYDPTQYGDVDIVSLLLNNVLSVM